MKTFTQLTTRATDLSLNTSTSNFNRVGELINDRHRYLLQKYFDNERTATTSTIGGNTLTLTGVLSMGATTATLSNVWAYPTGTEFCTFSNGQTIQVNFINGSASISWLTGLKGTQFQLTNGISAGATSATLSSAWALPSGSYTTTFSDLESKSVTYTNGSTAISWTGGLTNNVSAYVVSGVISASISFLGFQAYPIPANISKIKDNTITVGQQKFTPTEIRTRIEWDRVNYLPYNSDIPNYFFLYNGFLNLFPIPSTTGNILTFNYKTRVADMTYADYGIQPDGSNNGFTLATMTVGSTAVTGTNTSWNTTGGFPLNTDLTFANLFLRADPATGGDGIWYQIQSFQSNTALTLLNPVINAPNITSSTKYTIGQIPLLSEDFHDMLIYGSLMIYFSTIVKDKEKYETNKMEYESRLELLSEYAGTKTALSVDLGQDPPSVNPNLFPFSS